MKKLYNYLKYIFSSTPPEEPLDPEQLKANFKRRYGNFRGLLTANNNALQAMAELEKIYYSGDSYRMAVVRSKITTILVNVYKMIRNLREMADGRYQDLETIFEQIGNDLEVIIEKKPKRHEGPFILPLAEIGRGEKDQAGEKMANLGEVATLSGLLVPPGFVITASATSHFLTAPILAEINRRLQILDPDDLDQLFHTCEEIKKIVRESLLPPDLEELLHVHYGRLEKLTHRGVKVAMRSSALGEDSAGVSFAGLYRSILHRDEESLAMAYKEVIAGKYGTRAVAYRRKRGYRHEDIEMCVGCMVMIDGLVSGVTYSKDPSGDDQDTIRINAVSGLATSVVDGTRATDLYLVSREKPHTLVYSEIRQALDNIANPHSVPSTLTYSQLKKLAEAALALEEHFGAPQDIEWSLDHQGRLYILQSRSIPFHQQQITAKPVIATDGNDNGEGPILFGGICAAKGTVSGEVMRIDSVNQLQSFPKGAVLLVEHPLPEWAPLLGRASALIAGHGSEAGHLATVAREFAIPALLGLPEALTTLENGQTITVNASARAIYNGCREDLLRVGEVKRDIMAGSPVQRLVTEALQHITPLNLNDPASHQFKSKWCETLHDITRFCHEKSVTEMFNFGEKYNFHAGAAKRLVGKVPLEWWVIDLADGFQEGIDVQGPTIRVEDIVSLPMQAIWQGISAFPWEGPPRVSMKGFGSIIFQSAMRPDLDPSVASNLTTKNYFLISKNFCNLSVRLGYHYAMIEAYISELLTENYVTFRFKGGAADMRRKAVRARLLSEILEAFDFRIELRSDALLARIKKRPRGFLEERLQILGYLTLHARQLDMVMDDPYMVERYKQKFLTDIAEMLARRTTSLIGEAGNGGEQQGIAG
ncbi:MAG: PEP/pyruvate-binding domain-containing protein [Pseudomonadota bacterium]